MFKAHTDADRQVDMTPTPTHTHTHPHTPTHTHTHTHTNRGTEQEMGTTPCVIAPGICRRNANVFDAIDCAQPTKPRQIVQLVCLAQIWFIQIYFAGPFHDRLKQALLQTTQQQDKQKEIELERIASLHHNAPRHLSAPPRPQCLLRSKCKSAFTLLFLLF